MVKTYKITEDQMKLILGIKNKNTQIKEESPNNSESKYYTSNLSGSDLEFDIDYSNIFKLFNYKHGEVWVDGKPLDIEVSCDKANFNYTIELEYDESGIIGAIVVVRGVTLTGEIVLEDDARQYSKDWSIVYDEYGLKENSFSGEFVFGDNKITVPQIAKQVSIKATYGGENKHYFSGIYAKSTEIYVRAEDSKTVINMFY